MLLHALNEFESAEAAYARAHALDPREFQWPYGLGVVRALLGKHAAAADALRDAVQLRPAYLPARVRLAEELLLAGDLKAAGSSYSVLLDEHPELAAVQYGIGKLKAATGDRAAAIDRYVRACELFPEFGAAHYALAMAYRDQGDSAKAQQHLSTYQQHKLRWPPLEDPALDRVKALVETGRTHLAEGVYLAAQNRIAEAIEEHKRALALDPALEQAEVNLISLYGELGDWSNAEAHYRAALALNPNLVDVHYDYGVLLVKQGKTREAAEAFRRALEIDPYFAPAHNNLGQMLEVEGRLDEAADQYRRAIENEPTFRTARFNLGRMLVALNRSRDAIEQFQKLLMPEDEETPKYMFALAAAYVRAGDVASGVRYAEQAKERATALGQRELAATIERDLRQLKK
jgi:tetratricopeptide (TPR) repeat protein